MIGSSLPFGCAIKLHATTDPIQEALLLLPRGRAGATRREEAADIRDYPGWMSKAVPQSAGGDSVRLACPQPTTPLVDASLLLACCSLELTMDVISGCARCRAPMRLLDSSALGQSQFDMLSSVAADVQSAHGHCSSKQSQQQQQHGISRLPPSLQSAYTHNPARLHQPQIHKSNYNKPGDKSPASSFIVLSQSQTSDASSSFSSSVSPSAAEAKVTRSAALYHLLNTSSAIDHPLCIECADALQEAMNAQLDAVKAERQRYLAFDKELQAREKLDQQSPEELDAQLQKMREEEAETIEQLKQAEREQEELERQMRELDVEERELQAQEEKCVSGLYTCCICFEAEF